MINSEEGQSYLGHEDGTGLPHLFSATFHRILVSACFVPGRPCEPSEFAVKQGREPRNKRRGQGQPVKWRRTVLGGTDMAIASDGKGLEEKTPLESLWQKETRFLSDTGWEWFKKSHTKSHKGVGSKWNNINYPKQIFREASRKVNYEFHASHCHSKCNSKNS